METEQPPGATPPNHFDDIAAVWPLYAAHDWILQHEGGRWFVYADYRAMEDGQYLGAAESAPLAICRALTESEKK